MPMDSSHPSGRREKQVGQQQTEDQHLLSAEVHPVTHEAVDAGNAHIGVDLARMRGLHRSVLGGELENAHGARDSRGEE